MLLESIALFQTKIPYFRQNMPNLRPNCSKSIPVFRPKWLKNHTLWCRTNLYSLYKGVHPLRDDCNLRGLVPLRVFEAKMTTIRVILIPFRILNRQNITGTTRQKKTMCTSKGWKWIGAMPSSNFWVYSLLGCLKVYWYNTTPTPLQSSQDDHPTFWKESQR